MKLTISLGLTPEEVESGAKYPVTLPDGSVVVLNNEAGVVAFDAPVVPVVPVEPVEPVEPPAE